MRMKSIVLIFIALGCGLVASIGISQVMDRGSSSGSSMEMEQILVALNDIDIGAKLEVYELINELAARGAAIVLISSEMPEVIGMADRIVVLREGRVAGELAARDATPEAVLDLATRAAGGDAA